jgi:DNA-binding transcriptional MocR family regulator
MPLPSKQQEIYEYLLDDIRRYYYPGARLPTERIYAQRLGIARQTLRSTLKRLQEEKRIAREKSGTYVLDEGTGSRPNTKDNPGPVHVLLPCPDFTEATNDSSIINQQNLIRGAMRAAVEYGTQVVTIPVSETNKPEDIT